MMKWSQLSNYGLLILDLIDKIIVLEGVTWSLKRSYMESQEALRGVARGAPWSHKKSCMESQESCQSDRRSRPESKEELSGKANFVSACFPQF